MKNKIKSEIKEITEGLFCFFIIGSSVLFLKYNEDIDNNFKIFSTFENETIYFQNLKNKNLKKEMKKKSYIFKKKYQIKNTIYNKMFSIKITKKLKENECKLLKKAFINSKNIYFNKNNCTIYKSINYKLIDN
jgi:hypothetical protein